MFTRIGPTTHVVKVSETSGRRKSRNAHVLGKACPGNEQRNQQDKKIVPRRSLSSHNIGIILINPQFRLAPSEPQGEKRWDEQRANHKRIQ